MRYEDFSCGLLRLGSGRGLTGQPNTAHGSSVVQATITPASVAAATAILQTGFTLTGVRSTDIVLCVSNPISNSTAVTVVVPTANDTVSIGFINPTAGALTPTSGTYTFVVFKTQ